MKNNSGVGGSRTRVQTSDQKAFYKFRFRLIFELALTETCPNQPYHLYWKTQPMLLCFDVDFYGASI